MNKAAPASMPMMIVFTSCFVIFWVFMGCYTRRRATLKITLTDKYFFDFPKQQSLCLTSFPFCENTNRGDKMKILSLTDSRQKENPASSTQPGLSFESHTASLLFPPFAPSSPLFPKLTPFLLTHGEPLAFG
jgi:hypothetical protein